jgi:DNA-binding transcriptional ArsR family regulator
MEKGAEVFDRLPALPALDVLGEPTRRLIVQLLARRPASVGELSRILGQSQPLVSKHLRALREGGLVEATSSELDGRVRVYDLRRDELVALEVWLADVRAEWHRRTRLTATDPEYYKHPGPGVNLTTRGTLRKRYPRPAGSR